MANAKLASKLNKHQQVFRKETYARNKDHYKNVVNNPPNADAVLLTCSDSRVIPAHIFASEAGDEFVDRSIGNVYTDNTQVVINFALLHKGARLILVMGHSDCAAMKCVLDRNLAESVPNLPDWLATHCKRAYEKAAQLHEGNCSNCPKGLKEVTQANILHQVFKARLWVGLLSSQCQRPTLEQETQVVGLYYDIKSGRLQVYRDWGRGQPKWLPASRVLKHLPL